MSEQEGYDVLDIVNELLETDQAFYGIVRFLDANTRNHIVAAHMRNTSNLVGLLRMYMSQSPSLTINIPITTDTSGNFLDPVPVVPTREQILAAVEQHVHVQEVNCSICQESMTCGTRLRACGHMFHSQCISQWLSMNTRCPMCRHDIRDLRTTGDVQTNEGSGVHPNE